MNHKPFEDMIFTTDDLKDSDRVILQNHIVTCEDCRLLSQAWEHVSLDLHASTLAEPAPGFTKRWQLRLEANIARQQRRQTLLILAFCILGAGLLLGALALLAFPLAGSPLELIMVWISRAGVLISTASIFQNMATNLVKALAAMISPLWLVLLLGIGSLLAVLWAASLRVLLNTRRVIQ